MNPAGDPSAAPVPRRQPGTTWAVDLDGVVWLAGEPIPGVSEAVARLRADGVRVLFATNNSAYAVTDVVKRLAGAGIDADAEDVVTSAQAAATLVEPGETVLAMATDGVVEALTRRGARVVDQGPSDAVVVGWTRFDFDRVSAAVSAILGGARLIATNDDPTLPTPTGPLPGTGALLASVSTAAAAVPEVAGKPHQPMADAISDRAGAIAVVVGDRPSTDGLLARRLAAPFALVLSGVTRPGTPLPNPPPDFVARDLGALVPEVDAGR